MTVIVVVVVAVVLMVGWILLLTTSASLLLPNRHAALDRLAFGLSVLGIASSINSTSSSRFFDIQKLKLQIHVLLHVGTTYLLILPLASYCWILDEILFASYKTISIEQPLIIISCPRAGTTSFHRTLALDDRFYVTPTMMELVLPFLCLQKLLYGIQNLTKTNNNHPTASIVVWLERFLKWCNRVTPEVEARHPISLFSPDADDILLGEWHWVSVGAVRTFPRLESWKQHYLMNDKEERQRSLLLHQRMCQKVLYQRGGNIDMAQRRRRLLLRSHLSPCIQEFQELYPDAIVVGIVRDPVHVLRSFAGLSTVAVQAATGVNMLVDVPVQRAVAAAAEQTTTITNNEATIKNDTKAKTTTITTWPMIFVQILLDMMGRESALYNQNYDHESPWKGRCHYVTFDDFKADPLTTLSNLYHNVNANNNNDNNSMNHRLQPPMMMMTKQFERAIERGLGHHESYPARHVYQNPTLEEMGIDEQDYRNLPNVKLYSSLLLTREHLERKRK